MNRLETSVMVLVSVPVPVRELHFAPDLEPMSAMGTSLGLPMDMSMEFVMGAVIASMVAMM